MAYDHVYLQLIAQKIAAEDAQPRIRQLLGLRSQIDLEKQRQVVEAPKSRSSKRPPCANRSA